MSEKYYKALRREERDAITLNCYGGAADENRNARFLTARLMPLIPFVVMVLASEQGSVFLPEGCRDHLYITIGGWLIFAVLWIIDVMLLKKNYWAPGNWKWLGLIAPVGFLYLWIRAKNTDKEYAYAIAYAIMKGISLLIVGPAILI